MIYIYIVQYNSYVYINSEYIYMCIYICIVSILYMYIYIYKTISYLSTIESAIIAIKVNR